MTLLWLLISTLVFAQENPERLPLWEYGFGLGHLRFEQYPASDQYRSLNLPFPTFQFRGKVIRADDQDGARAYLLKQDRLSFEFSGAGLPPVDSDSNKAREGMSNIPLNVLFGPQMVYKLAPGFVVELAVFKAISTDLYITKDAGEVLQLQFDFRRTWDRWASRLAVTFQAASQKFMNQYFTVRETDTWVNRPVFQANGGFLSSEISLFQSYTVKRTSVFLGFAWNHYADSVNRGSPLHKIDSSVNYLLALTYVLGESKTEALPEEQIRGVL